MSKQAKLVSRIPVTVFPVKDLVKDSMSSGRTSGAKTDRPKRKKYAKETNERRGYLCEAVRFIEFERGWDGIEDVGLSILELCSSTPEQRNRETDSEEERPR